MKTLIFNHLKDYACHQGELKMKQHKLCSHFQRKKKQMVIEQLRSYTQERVLLNSIVYKAQQTLKSRVLKSMVTACRK